MPGLLLEMVKKVPGYTQPFTVKEVGNCATIPPSSSAIQMVSSLSAAMSFLLQVATTTTATATTKASSILTTQVGILVGLQCKTRLSNLDKTDKYLYTI